MLFCFCDFGLSLYLFSNIFVCFQIIVLLISGIITLIQMKNHILILKLNNDTKSYLDKIYNAI